MAKEKAGTNNQGWFARRRERPGARKTGVRAACEFCALIADVRTFCRGELLRLPPLIR